MNVCLVVGNDCMRHVSCPQFNQLSSAWMPQLQDFRDTKIVHLAKKCRNLTVLLNKERALKDKSGSFSPQSPAWCAARVVYLCKIMLEQV
jgi:hypothetical protein